MTELEEALIGLKASLNELTACEEYETLDEDMLALCAELYDNCIAELEHIEEQKKCLTKQ